VVKTEETCIRIERMRLETSTAQACALLLHEVKVIQEDMVLEYKIHFYDVNELIRLVVCV
jgi:hypothetical protein